MLIGCIPAYNEERNIGNAIDLLWACGCERVIVTNGQWDSFEPGAHWLSQDRTREIALEHGAEVIDAPEGGWPTEHEARTCYLLGQEGDWYLCIDADERPDGLLPANVIYPDEPGPDAYLLSVVGGDHVAPQMRLFKHRGCMTYEYAHYLPYSDGVLVDRTHVCHGFRLIHIDAHDTHRKDVKRRFYGPRAEREEQRMGGSLNFPEKAGLDKAPGMRYVGNGRWIPGVPARDLTGFEADSHRDAIAAAAATGRPIYEPIEQA